MFARSVFDQKWPIYCLVPSRALADFGTRETSTSEARKGSWEGLSLPMMHCDKA